MLTLKNISLILTLVGILSLFIVSLVHENKNSISGKVIWESIKSNSRIIEVVSNGKNISLSCQNCNFKEKLLNHQVNVIISKKDKNYIERLEVLD